MYLGLISEVMTDGKICMYPPAFITLRNHLLANIDGRDYSHYVADKPSGGFVRCTVSEPGCPPSLTMDYVGDAEWIDYCTNLRPDDRIINVVEVQGPMTRNGAECSYGSMNIRDKIVAASALGQCKGHIIICNTPGGMSSCIQDFRIAINHAHDSGQKVFMLIDGMCASGGAFLSGLCDGVYYVNSEDEIGSIGMYSAFFTLKDGAVNTITSEVYHEYYASLSADKNAWLRAASEGDMKLVADDVERSLAFMVANLRSDRPSILETQCTGRMYKMKDVEGSLVDGQGTIELLATALIKDWNERSGAPLPRKLTTDQPSQPESDTSPLTQTIMKQYSAIPAAIGEGPMESLDGELTLSPDQATALEEVLASIPQASEELQERITQLKEEHSTEQEKLRVTIEALQRKIALLEQERTDLRASLEELNNSSGPEPKAGEQPSANGAQVPTPRHIVAATCYDPRLTAEENYQRYCEAQARLRKSH